MILMKFHNMGIDDKKKQEGKVSFFKLFSFADTKDVVLMTIGTIAAMANGFSMPLMTFIFGELINTFGHANKTNVVHLVSKVISSIYAWFLISFFLSCGYHSFWYLVSFRLGYSFEEFICTALVRVWFWGYIIPRIIWFDWVRYVIKICFDSKFN